MNVGFYDPPTATELADLATLADQRGISREAAVARYGWGRSFAMLAHQIESEFPRSYAGAVMESGTDAWIGFSDRAPDAARLLIDEFNARLFGKESPVRVVEGRGFTEAELNATTMALHEATYAQWPWTSDVSTGYDIRTGQISTSVQILRDGGDSLREARLIIGPLVESITDADLSVTHQNISHDEAIHRGGSIISYCTAGFTVVSAGGTRGMSTAAHCPNSQTMNGIQLTLGGEHNGSWGDVQWQHAFGSLLESFLDDFYAGSSNGPLQVDVRDVAGIGFSIVGLPVCKNGRYSYKDCDEIKELGHCVNGACNLVRVFNDNTVEGDSGGPYFYGNYAYGVHKGDSLHDWKIRDVYTRVDLFDEALGVSVAST